MTSDKAVGNKEQLEKIEIPITTRVLIVGSGPIAIVAAQELVKAGHDVLLCSPEAKLIGNPHVWGPAVHIPFDLESMTKEMQEDPRIQIIAPAEILEFNGAPGAFQVRLKVNGRASVLEEVGAVILANEPFLKTSFEAWGMNESERVKSLSWMESSLSSSFDEAFLSDGSPSKIVFLSGFTHHANPFSQNRAYEAAFKLASKKGNQVFFITEHLKVAHTGMERLTRKAREAGVLLVKLTGTRPEIQSAGDKITVEYYDDGLGESVTIHPDFLVLEEAYEAPDEVAKWADRLGISVDRPGFFQGDNIYNRPIYTNRAGIWVIGSSKGPVAFEEGIEEAKAAALEIRQILGRGDHVFVERRLLFNEARCGKCLTCFRLCPHRAISYFEGKPEFYDLACQACGICAAGCPMDAIQIAHFTDDQIRSQIENVAPVRSGPKGRDIVHLVAFCCENSAFEAARLAALDGVDLPEGLELLRVPCAGRVDLDYLLKAFDLGADGVMMLACHPESCKSVTGNMLAQQRVEIIREALGDVGLEKERLFFGTLGPATSAQFVKIAKTMEQTIRSLGESPVRRYLREGARNK